MKGAANAGELRQAEAHWTVMRQRASFSFLSCHAGVVAEGDNRGYPAHDKAAVALDMSWCSTRHRWGMAHSCVDVLQLHYGDRSG